MRKVIYTIEVEINGTIIGAVKSQSRDAAYRAAEDLIKEWKWEHRPMKVLENDLNAEPSPIDFYD